MPKFSYKARNKNGEIITGVLEEASEKSLYNKLSAEGLNLISAKENNGGKKFNIDFLTNFLPIPTIEVITFVHLL